MMPDSGLLSQLTAHEKVMLWMDNKALTDKTPHFETLNYLFDGLIYRQLTQPGTWNEVSFVHTLYGENFWLTFANTAAVKSTDVIQSLKALVPAHHTRLLVVGEKLSADWQAALAARFTEIRSI